MTDEAGPTVMVASTVYGIEDLLEQVHGVLSSLGYQVWMSHKGTIPTNPDLSNEENCIEAVKCCDVFIGIITGRHGSGIFRKEVETAVDEGALRWFLVHHEVVIARQLLKQFRFDEGGNLVDLDFEETPVLQSLEVLETYEYAIQQHIRLEERKGNWVQGFSRPEDALEFIRTQLRDVDRVRGLIEERRRDDP